MNAVEPDTFDYFELFGLAASYDIDMAALHRKYLSLTRSIHPDVAGRADEENRQRALGLSAELNQAYETLRDPVARAEYLLNQAGGGPGGSSRSVPAHVLGEVMRLREEIEEAVAAGDAAALAACRVQVSGRYQFSVDAIGALSRILSARAPETRDKLREQLNEAKYWRNLLDQLPPAEST